MLKHLNNLISKTEITLEDICAVMGKLYLNGNFKIAVAVSGGSDSLCLAILLKEWSKYSNANITALIVNHNIRDNMKEEIEYVSSILKKYSIDYVVLSVNNHINKYNGIQKNARNERYKSLLSYCRVNNIGYLAIGHQFNDLIETVHMRRQRSENIWGDAGMSYTQNFKDVLLFRPFLFFTKYALQNTLKKLNQKWVEDPSNNNAKFERAKVRKYLTSVRNIEANSLKEINKLREKRISLEKECLDFLVNNVNVSKFGTIDIYLYELLNLQEKLIIVILRLLVKFCNNKYYMIKISKIKNLISKIKESIKNNNKQLTLGGCLFVIQIKNNRLSLSIVKEYRNIKTKSIILNNSSNYLCWDNRFIIANLQDFPNNYFFANLSTKEYNLVCSNKDFKKFVKYFALKKEIILSLPWLFNRSNQPICSWFEKLEHDNYIKVVSKNSIIQDFFCNFSFAKLNINTT